MWKLVKGLLIAVFALTAGIALIVGVILNEEEAAAEKPPESVEGIPARLLDAYANAATKTTAIRPKCTGMRWGILAGIGRVESTHMQNLDGYTISTTGDVDPEFLGPVLNGDGFAAITDTDSGRYDGDTTWDRAVGPMQFIPQSWETFG